MNNEYILLPVSASQLAAQEQERRTGTTNEEYILFPSSVTQLAEQAKKATDAYLHRQMSSKDMEYLVALWHDSYGARLYTNDAWAPRFIRIMGKKRALMFRSVLVKLGKNPPSV